MDEDTRREIWRRHRRLAEAYRAGDLAAVKAALAWPEDFPNTVQSSELGLGERPLITALRLSPLSFLRSLLELGADANYDAPDGFPPLFSAIDADRPDRTEALALLLDHGADPRHRGLFDMTPLHYAVARRDIEAVKLFMAHGADPNERTRIDDCTSALDDARAGGFAEAVAAMGG